MTQVRDVLGRARPLAVAVAFVAASFIPLLSIHSASADALTNRSLMVTSSVTSGDSTSTVAGNPGNGDKVGHTYTFTTGAGAALAVQGISFEVCDSAFGYLATGGAAGHCVDTTAGADAVAGFDVQGFTTVSVNGVAFTFTRVDASYWTLTNATGTSLSAETQYTITFTPTASAYFVNPSADGTFFVHLALYGTTSADYDTNFNDATFDEGTVTSSTATAIDINTRVQETLKFSVEGDMRDSTANDNTSDTPAGGTGAFNEAALANANCDALNGSGRIVMGDTASNALSSGTTFDARSYFRLATNSANGAIVYYAGDTLRSGSTETIAEVGATATAIANPASTNTEQFGMAFDLDSASHSFAGGATGLVANAQYTDDDTGVAFVSFGTNPAPQPIASSTGIVQCDTGAVRYIANIADETAAGIYATRVIYIASPSY